MLYRAETPVGGPTLIQGQAHHESTAETIKAIRELICRENEIAAQNGSAEPEAEEDCTAPSRSVVTPRAVSVVPRSHRTPLVARATEPAPDVAEPQMAASGPLARLRGFEPNWRLSEAILLLAIFLLEPWYVPGLAALLLAISAIRYLPENTGKTLSDFAFAESADPFDRLAPNTRN